MSRSFRVDKGSLSLDVQLHVHRVCQRFEAAWKTGDQRPRIEDHLADTPEPVHSMLLCELLALDFAYRRRAGDKPTPGEYGQRFPQHQELIQAVFLEVECFDPQPGQAPLTGSGGRDTELMCRPAGCRCGDRGGTSGDRGC